MFPTSTPEREKQLATLIEYFGGRSDGDELTWLAIEHETGVPMNETGKQLARSALRKNARPYEAVRGIGVRLSAPQSALSIMGSRFLRIDNSVRRADKTRQQLTERHLEQMPSQDQQKMLTLAAFFGTVRAFAKEASKRVLGR